MKRILVILLASLMLFSFVACDDNTPTPPASEEPDTPVDPDTPTPEEPEVKPGEELKALFALYGSNVKVSEDGSGILLGMEDLLEEGKLASVNGPSAYLDESKLYAFDEGQSATVEFTLDLSSLIANNYTSYSLGFSNSAAEWIGEFFMLIKKDNSAGNYTVATYPGICHEVINYIADEADMHEENLKYINDSNTKKITVNAEDDVLDIVLTASYTDDKPTVTATVNGEKLDLTYSVQSFTDVAGLRYLWNVISDVNTVELTSLEFTVK